MEYTDTPPEVKGMVFILRKLDYSYRNIEAKLKQIGFIISHTTSNKIMDRWDKENTFDNYRKDRCGKNTIFSIDEKEKIIDKFKQDRYLLPREI